jgi:hypothetical protein
MYISTSILKNYILDKLLEIRLLFIREQSQITDFLLQLNSLKKVLIILPRDRAEEVYSRKYLSQIRRLFKGTRISTLDVGSLRGTDKNWLGMPSQDFIKKLYNEKFDLVVDLNSFHDRLCTFLGARAGAPMRLHVMPGKYEKVYNLQFRVHKSASMDVRFRILINYLAQFRGINRSETVSV